MWRLYIFSEDSTPKDTIGESRYAQPGEETCPVKSFQKYVSKLHLDLDDLWQRTRDSFCETEDYWYIKSPQLAL